MPMSIKAVTKLHVYWWKENWIIMNYYYWWDIKSIIDKIYSLM